MQSLLSGQQGATSQGRQGEVLELQSYALVPHRFQKSQMRCLQIRQLVCIVMMKRFFFANTVTCCLEL